MYHLQCEQREVSQIIKLEFSILKKWNQFKKQQIV